MFSLEERIRPCSAAPWRSDLVGIGMLLALTVIMLPGWPAGDDRLLEDIKNQMASPYLPAAMGFLLALRCGAIDLSVWACFGLGGLVSAGLINAGLSPAKAMAIGACAGLLPGLANAALVAGARLPAPLATAGVAGLLIWGIHAFVGTAALTVPVGTFDSWHVRIQNQPQPLGMTRMLLVSALYGAVMLTLIWGRVLARQVGDPGSRRRLAVALAGSAVLSAAGGAIWLVENFQAPAQERLIGDMRIPAAAVLAGGALLAGPGRTMLAGVFLPTAMVLTLAWRQDVWYLDWHGYQLGLAAMIVMVLGAQFTCTAALERRPARRWYAAAGVLMSLAVLAVAFSGYLGREIIAVHIAAAIAWIAGVLLAVIARLRRRVTTSFSA